MTHFQYVKYLVYVLVSLNFFSSGWQLKVNWGDSRLCGTNNGRARQIQTYISAYYWQIWSQEHQSFTWDSNASLDPGLPFCSVPSPLMTPFSSTSSHNLLCISQISLAAFKKCVSCCFTALQQLKVISGRKFSPFGKFKRVKSRTRNI